MIVERCERQHAAEWDAYVATAPQASFYHRFGWKTVNERAFDHRAVFLAAREGGAIVGVLPIVQVSSWLFGNLACSMPFVNYAGPCADTPDAERALLDAAREVCDELDVSYLEMRSRHQLVTELPCSSHKVSVTLDLAPDPDTLWNNFKSGHRQEIRRGYKKGLTARVGGAELIDPFYDVMSESWRNLGTPLYHRRYFQMIAETFPEHIRLAVIYAGDEPAAAAFDGVHRDTVEGMWMGAKARYRTLLAGYVLYWELIKDACERGHAHFHLGRSTADSGGEAFKKKWNADSQPLYWYYVLRGSQEMPALNVNNPRYQRAIALWQRLPLGVTQFIGPSIARSIP